MVSPKMSFISRWFLINLETKSVTLSFSRIWSQSEWSWASHIGFRRQLLPSMRDMLDTQPIIRVFFIFSRLDVDTALSVLPAATAIRFSDLFKQDLFGSGYHTDICLKILNRLLPLIWLRHWVLRLFNNSLATCLQKTTHFAIIMMILYQGHKIMP